MDLLYGSKFQRAFLAGLVTSNELGAAGVTSETLRAALRKQRKDSLTLREVEVGDQACVLDAARFGLRLHVLQRFDCLDLVDRRAVIDTIRQRQMLPGNTQFDRKPTARRKLWHGHFFLMHDHSPSVDTYHSLRILEVLGGLEEIDREACVEGIRRFDLGRGLIGVRGRNHGLSFWRPAQEMFYHYESLRILGALDRINDLDRWVVRLHPTTRGTQSTSNEPRPLLYWREMEAAILQNNWTLQMAEEVEGPYLDVKAPD
jgi:hypothetical protein